MNLRERQKRETRALIQRAALELAAKSGIEGITNEAICEAAGVSQRTFHNYFPYKEAVFIVSPEPLPPDAVELFLAAPGELMSDLGELMAAHAAVLQMTPFLGRLMHDVVRSHPRLMPLQRNEFMKFDRQIQEVIATRLGLPLDHKGCAALAGAVLGCNRGTMERWMDTPDFDLPDAIRSGVASMVKLIRTPERPDPVAAPELAFE